MTQSNEFRQLLVADLALVMGIAPARDVAAALQRYWDGREERPLRLAAEIARIAGLDDEAVRRLETAAEDLVAQAGGDPLRALGLRGGIDGTIHAELTRLDVALPDAISAAGVESREPLRAVAPGRYRDFTVIGAGGMGIVYRALDTELNRPVALKIVRPDQRETEELDPLRLTPPEPGSAGSPVYDELYSRFLQEAWVTGALEHPGIVPIYEIGKTPTGLPFYTMRLVKGDRTLETAIESGEGEDRRALVPQFLVVCEAVRYAHSRGVVHRDLKPANVALGEFGEVVVLDWGLAKMHDRPDLARSLWQDKIREYREATDLRTVASALGTPGYMAPETARGAGADERSDVYSLGAILFRILTGRLPFELEGFAEFLLKLRTEKPPRADSLGPGVPRALADACEAALEPDPEKRLQSVGALEEVVRSWQREDAVEREVEALIGEASLGAEAFDGLNGKPLLAQVDRVSALCTRALDLRPQHRRGRELAARCEETRERAIRARVRAGRRRIMLRGAAAALLALTIAAVIVSLLLDKRRRESEAARQRAVRAEAITARALTSARALALANASAAEQADDHMLALLLAREAARTELRPETVTRLHGAVHDCLERVVFPAGRDVLSAAFSPDGRTLLTASNDRLARLWSIDGELLVEFPGHRNWVRSARFSPDGKQVVTGSSDRSARVWAVSGDLLAVLQGHEKGVLDARFSPDGERILTRSRDGTARIWTPAGESIATLVAGEGEAEVAAYSPDGERILLSSEDGSVTLWDPDGRKIRELVRYEKRANSASFSPDSSLVLTAGRNAGVDLWDRDGSRICRVIDGEPRVMTAVFSPDGERVHVSTIPAGVRTYDTEGRELRRLVPAAEDSATILAVPPAGGWLAGCGSERIVWIRSPEGELVSRCTGHRDRIHGLAFSPDGTRVLSWSRDGTARLWALREAEIATLPNHRAWLRSVMFSPSGEHLVAACRDDSARIWRLDGTPVAHLAGHEAGIRWVDVSSRGDRVLTGAVDGTVRIWDFSGRTLAELGGHHRDVAFSYFSPDGERVLTQDITGLARIWERRMVAVRAEVPDEQRPGSRDAPGPGGQGARDPEGPSRGSSLRLVRSGGAADRHGIRRPHGATLGPHRAGARRPARPHRYRLHGPVLSRRAPSRHGLQRRERATLGPRRTGGGGPPGTRTQRALRDLLERGRHRAHGFGGRHRARVRSRGPGAVRPRRARGPRLVRRVLAVGPPRRDLLRGRHREGLALPAGGPPQARRREGEQGLHGRRAPPVRGDPRRAGSSGSRPVGHGPAVLSGTLDEADVLRPARDRGPDVIIRREVLHHLEGATARKGAQLEVVAVGVASRRVAVVRQLVGEEDDGAGGELRVQRREELPQAPERHVRPPPDGEGRGETVRDTVEGVGVGDLKRDVGAIPASGLRLLHHRRVDVRGEHGARGLRDHVRPVAGAAGDLQHVASGKVPAEALLDRLAQPFRFLVQVSGGLVMDPRAGRVVVGELTLQRHPARPSISGVRGSARAPA